MPNSLFAGTTSLAPWALVLFFAGNLGLILSYLNYEEIFPQKLFNDFQDVMPITINLLLFLFAIELLNGFLTVRYKIVSVSAPFLLFSFYYRYIMTYFNSYDVPDAIFIALMPLAAIRLIIFCYLVVKKRLFNNFHYKYLYAFTVDIALLFSMLMAARQL